MPSKESVTLTLNLLIKKSNTFFEFSVESI